MAVAERELTPATDGPRPMLWSRAQYYQMAEMGWFDGRRVELIEGEVFVMPPMDVPHFTAINVIGDVLRRAFGGGYFVSSQCPLDLGLASDPEPDFAVIRGDPRDFTRATGLPSDAALVVEVSDSTLPHDRSRKAALYARAAISDYWIVNLRQRQAEVHRRPEALPEGLYGYAEVTVYKPGQTIIPLAASSAGVAVADLLP